MPPRVSGRDRAVGPNSGVETTSRPARCGPARREIRAGWAGGLGRVGGRFGPGQVARESRTGTNLAWASAQLGLGVGVGDDAAAGEEPHAGSVDGARAQGDAPLAVAAGVHPAHRPGVAAAVHPLDLGDQRGRLEGGGAADGGGGVQRRGEVEGGDGLGVVDDPGDVGGQVHHVGQVQHERRLGHVHRRAVRLERVGDRAHGVLVLLEVLRRPRPGWRPAPGRARRRRCGGWCRPAPARSPARARGAPASRGWRRTCRRRGTSSTSGTPPARRCSGQRTSTSSSAVATRSRASTTFSRSPPPMREHGVGDRRHPLLGVQGAVGEGDAGGRVGRDGGGQARLERSRGCRGPRRSSRRGRHGGPRPPTGTCSTEWPGSSAKAKVPKQTSPVPGSSTSSRTTARAVVSSHHFAASLKRVGPCGAHAARRSPSRPGPRRGAAS